MAVHDEVNGGHNVSIENTEKPAQYHILLRQTQSEWRIFALSLTGRFSRLYLTDHPSQWTSLRSLQRIKIKSIAGCNRCYIGLMN